VSHYIITQQNRISLVLVDLPTEVDIISFCKNHQSQQGQLRGTNRVIIQDGVAIKYGQVTFQEVENQRRIYQILDTNIVRVPLIYRYFTSQGTDWYALV